MPINRWMGKQIVVHDSAIKRHEPLMRATIPMNLKIMMPIKEAKQIHPRTLYGFTDGKF